MGKAYLEFEGFDKAIARLTKLGGNTKSTTEKALKKTHEIITDKAEKAIRPHKETGATEKSLYREGKVDWAGTLASVNVGFSISKGGLASIFLMYGTPRMKKDQNLYNSVWGTATRKEVLNAQEEIFFEEIRKLDG